MELLTIRQLKAATVAGPVSALLHAQAASVQLKPTRAGGEYLELRIADAEDEFALRVWSDAPGYMEARALVPRSFIGLQGEWTSGQFGLEAKNWQLRSLNDDEMTGLLAGPPALCAKQAADWVYIMEKAASLRDPRLRALCQRFLDEYGERFRRTAAAREYHHARRGGLVEHVAQMMRSAGALCDVYPSVNRDLVLAGVLFHDSGKLWENCYAADGFTMPHTGPGELMGHITLGIELVNKLWRRITDDDAAAEWLSLEPASGDVRLHLLHLIGSHHGEYQFGSPVLPRTPEAMLLHHIDNIDAKLEMMFTSYQTSSLLGKDIFERMRPLPANLARPLAAFESGPGSQTAPAADEEPAAGLAAD